MIKPINYKSFNYYNEKNDIEKLSRNYEPKYIGKDAIIDPLDYFKAMLWKYNYYFLDDESNNNYFYKYDDAPSIDQLVEFKDFDKIQLDYKTTHIMPIDQLCFISPIDVSEYVSKQKINKLIANKLYKLMKINLPEIELKDNLININEIFECTNARYLNKCDLKFKIINFNEFKEFLF